MRYIHPINEIRQRLSYNPDTGKFIWRANNKEAGTIYNNYERIMINGIRYFTHKLVFYYINGVWNNIRIEHLNSNTLDNRLSNLREFKCLEKIKNELNDDLKLFKEHLDYDSEAGNFKWLINSKRAGVKTSAGYITIGFCNKLYKAHRLAWFFTYNKWPKFIDHINGEKSDNRICNLREVTIRENGQNRKEHRNGRLVGCTYDKKRNVWTSQLCFNGTRKSLGEYETELEAHLVYKKFLEENNLI